MLSDAFLKEWNDNLARVIAANTPSTITQVLKDDERCIVWALNDRVLRYHKVSFDRCYVTLTVTRFDSDKLTFQVGLVYMSSTSGAEATVYNTFTLPSERYLSLSVLYAKIVIAAANLTRQGKIEANICETLMTLITLTLGAINRNNEAVQSLQPDGPRYDFSDWNLSAQVDAESLRGWEDSNHACFAGFGNPANPPVPAK